MISHKYISDFIRQGFTAPTEACEIQFHWLTGLSNGWLENWPAKCSKALVIDVEVTHMHAEPSGVRPDALGKPQSDAIHFRSISQHCQWPLTVYSSLLRGLGLLRKAQHDSLPHLSFTPAILSSALLHMSASSDTYVAFRVCQRGCFFSRLPWMSASPITLWPSVALFCSCIHSSIILQVKLIFCHSERRADRGNQSWSFRKRSHQSVLCWISW